MHYIQGEDRTQSTLFPALLDDYIGSDNPVRFLDAYVAQVNFAELGFEHSSLAATGRPPYQPATLLKLYLYGYLNRVRSSRQLEKAARCNIELLWLLQRLTPDFKTISDFRKNNALALRRVFRHFTLLCKEWNLFGLEFIAIDGSKFAASNHTGKTYTEDGLAKKLAAIDEHINEYTQLLDSEDHREEALDGPLSTEELQQHLAQLQARKVHLEALQQRMEHDGAGQISLTDPDSRKMQTGNKGIDVCYNVQMTVDDKHHLVADFDVTSDGTDKLQLYRMAQRTKEIFGLDRIAAAADGGYYHEPTLYQCQNHGVISYVPEPKKSQNAKLGLYTDKDFHYNAADDTYSCPAKATLTSLGLTVKDGKTYRYYGTRACRGCPCHARCTRAHQRRIYRWEHEQIIEQLQDRLKREPEKVNKRRTLVEHPFGTIKEFMAGRSFLVRTIPKVTAEMSLLMLGYNLKRVMTILGVPHLLEALSTMRQRLTTTIIEPSLAPAV